MRDEPKGGQQRGGEQRTAETTCNETSRAEQRRDRRDKAGRGNLLTRRQTMTSPFPSLRSTWRVCSQRLCMARHLSYSTGAASSSSLQGEEETIVRSAANKEPDNVETGTVVYMGAQKCYVSLEREVKEGVFRPRLSFVSSKMLRRSGDVKSWDGTDRLARLLLLLFVSLHVVLAVSSLSPGLAGPPSLTANG
eukprot:750065-Hanusia_phi.AAC.1